MELRKEEGHRNNRIHKNIQVNENREKVDNAHQRDLRKDIDSRV